MNVLPIILLFLLVMAVTVYFFHKNFKTKNREIFMLKVKIDNLNKQLTAALTDLDKFKQSELSLGNSLDVKQNELTNFALNIIQKNNFLEQMKTKVNEIKNITNDEQTLKSLNELSLQINRHIAIDKNRKDFLLQIDDAHKGFFDRLLLRYPNLTRKEMRLAAYLRLNLSSKDIASLLNISPKSVEINRYRLRKKIAVDTKVNLQELIAGI